NVGNMTFVDCTSWIGTIQRSLTGEGRKNLMAHLDQIIKDAITAIEDYKDTEFRRLIVNYLSRAKMGIANLIPSYMDDPNIIAQINVHMANIDLQLEKNIDLLEDRRKLSEMRKQENEKKMERK